MPRRDALTRPLPGVNDLQILAAREFRGGWNTYDSPLNLATKYLIEMRNVYPDTSGRLRLRFGTSAFADMAGLGDEIIAVTYYNTALVVVMKDGRIYTLDSVGAATLRWDTAIAGALPGAPAAWSTGLTFVSFCQLGGSLIFCNGVDKPLIMSSTYAVNYLADLGTGSNVNVPRAKYCLTHDGYLVLAVTPTDTTTLYIGAKNAAGTFVGDPGVDNDAVNFSTSARISKGDPTITGLSSFRDKLVVTYLETVLILQLGEYASAAHVPRVDDTIAENGAVGHRCIVPLGDDVLFLDRAGMSSVQRALITGSLSPVRESTLISRDLQQALSPLSVTQLQNNVFTLHDRIAQQILFFIPKSVPTSAATDNNVFVYCFDKSQKFRAWAYFDQMAYRCGTRTTEDRIFLCAGLKIYYYRNQYEPLYSDYTELTGGSLPWSDGTFFTDGTGWSGINGQAIPFAFSLPWSEMRAPMKIKYSKYIHIITEGTGTFTAEMFIDNIITPSLSAAFTSSAAPYKSTITRNSTNTQLYAWTQKFTSMRMRFSGNSGEELSFVAVQIAYLAGSIRR